MSQKKRGDMNCSSQMYICSLHPTRRCCRCDAIRKTSWVVYPHSNADDLLSHANAFQCCLEVGVPRRLFYSNDLTVTAF
jgi:hypothetical protein